MKTLFVALGALALAQSAAASPCSDRIAQLQAKAEQTPVDKAAPPVVGGVASDATETTEAKLHHQPTAATAPDAGPDISGRANSQQALRNARFQNDLFRAQAANDSGDMAGCERAVEAAEKEMPR